MDALPAKDRTVRETLVFLQRLFRGCRRRDFAVRLWDGTLWEASPGTAPRFVVAIRRPEALRRMFWRPSELSLGEAFIFGDFDIEGDLEESFFLGEYLLSLRLGLADKWRGARFLLGLTRDASAERGAGAHLSGTAHSRQRDAQAIAYHYNVSNDFYRLWLDQRMVYSSAYFSDPKQGIDEAQEAKLDYLCRKLRLRPGQRLLDIGCGWGSLILHAARHYGVQALGITLSTAQAELATERIRKAGLAERCRVEVMDYRELQQEAGFDKLVSVGMFEHVGEERLGGYFRQAIRLLKPGGVFLNQGIAAALVAPFARGPSFIDRYVFPDGELVPVATTLRTAEECGFETRDVESLREHYALTLRQWVRRLEASYAEAQRLTSEITCRIWRLYMAGSAYRFRVGQLNIYQVLLLKPQGHESGLPLTRDDWYLPAGPEPAA